MQVVKRIQNPNESLLSPWLFILKASYCAAINAGRSSQRSPAQASPLAIKSEFGKIERLQAGWGHFRNDPNPSMQIKLEFRGILQQKS
jgi:hypothetical protein